MTEKKAIIFGHSHVWSVKRALADPAFKPGAYLPSVALCGTKEFPGSIVAYNSTGNQALNPALLSALHKETNDEAKNNIWLVSLSQGNYFNQLGMFSEEGYFDFVLPSRQDLPLNNKAVLLPYNAIRTSLEEKCSEMPPFLKRLRTLGYAGVIIVGPPPPPIVLTNVKELIASMEDKMDQVVVMPPETRLKLWSLQNEIMKSYCSKTGAIYLQGNLEGTMDDLGFLLPNYVKDSVHANYHHAKLLLKAVGKIISS